jgi:hypothetical protein
MFSALGWMDARISKRCVANNVAGMAHDFQNRAF